MLAKLHIMGRLGRAIFKSKNGVSLTSPSALTLPDKDYCLYEQNIEAEKLAKFHRLVHWPQEKAEFLHPCYPQIIAFPLHIRLLSQADFPFNLLGLVHIDNEIEQSRAIKQDEKFTIRSFVANISQHRKGLTFELHTELWIEQQRVWRSKGTNLFRCAHITKDTKAEEYSRPVQTDCRIKETWPLKSSLGRRYAGVSGDINPIHLYPLSAKFFGFKRHIAHGMWSQSRCLSALHPVSTNSFTASVKFQKPIYLPSKVRYCQSSNLDSIYFYINGEKGESHLSGELIKR